MQKIVVLFGMFLTFNVYAQEPQKSVCKNNTLCFKPAAKVDLNAKPSTILKTKTTEAIQPDYVILMNIPASMRNDQTPRTLSLVMDDKEIPVQYTYQSIFAGKTVIKGGKGNFSLVIKPLEPTNSYLYYAQDTQR